MYSIENIKHFFQKNASGKVIDDYSKNEILHRAKESIAENGFIYGGSTRYIFSNIYIEQLFEQDLGSSIEQLNILSGLAKEYFKIKQFRRGG